MSGDREEASWNTRDFQHKTQVRRPLYGYCWWQDSQNTDLSLDCLVNLPMKLEIWDLVWELLYILWSNLFKHIFVTYISASQTFFISVFLRHWSYSFGLMIVSGQLRILAVEMKTDFSLWFRKNKDMFIRIKHDIWRVRFMSICPGQEIRMQRICSRVRITSFSFGFITLDYLNIDVSHIIIGNINIQLDSFMCFKPQLALHTCSYS